MPSKDDFPDGFLYNLYDIVDHFGEHYTARADKCFLRPCFCKLCSTIDGGKEFQKKLVLTYGDEVISTFHGWKDCSPFFSCYST